MSGLWSAVQFLTRLPVPPGKRAVEPTVEWLPLVGFGLGGLLALAYSGLSWLRVSPPVTSTVLVVLLLALSGALHADGLIDTCDAVLGHASPERRLEIMRDPRAGSFGVVGLVCLVALKIAALGALPSGLRLQLLVLVPGLGRWAIVLVAGAFPYARRSGLGAPLKASATARGLIVASALPVAACIGVGWPGIEAGLVAAVTAVALGSWLMRMLPGLTGDCYGAVCEVVETLVWLCVSPLAHALGQT